MAQFRSTADIMDLALTNGGEVTNGNSPYESQLLNYLNRVHFAIVAGGTIPVGKDTTVKIDENWPWAKSKSPLTIKLQPKIETGTVSLANGSVSGTFSSGPADSVEGWYVRIPGESGTYRIAHHTAAGTSFSFDNEFLGTTGASLTYELFKLDYELVPEVIVTNSENDRIQFQEAAGVTLTGTLTQGTRTPSAHIAHVVSVLNSTGGTPTYTGSYDSITRKFTISSDRASSAVFVLVGTGTESHRSQHKTLGFDDSDTTNAASIVSTYPLGGIARLIEPIRVVSGSDGCTIFSVDAETMQRDYPLSSISEGLPTKCALVREDADGRMVLRFNGFPEEETKIEIDYVPLPRDLKDNSTSIPLVPRKHSDVLENAATFYLLLNKNDDRAQIYAQLLQGNLDAMVNQHRGSLQRSGENFGQIVPRADLVSRRKLFNREPY